MTYWTGAAVRGPVAAPQPLRAEAAQHGPGSLNVPNTQVYPGVDRISPEINILVQTTADEDVLIVAGERIYGLTPRHEKP